MRKVKIKKGKEEKGINEKETRIKRSLMIKISYKILSIFCINS
jgi:hypothetical protein